MIVCAGILVIFLIIVIFTVTVLDDNAKNKQKEETQKRSQKYASSLMEINKQFYELEEKCREWERKEKQIEDLRYEAKARQKRRATHKRRVNKK